MRDMALCDQAEEDEVPHIDTTGEWVQEVELSGRKDVWSSTEDIENAAGEWKHEVELTGRKDTWSYIVEIENASGEWKQEVALTGKEEEIKIASGEWKQEVALMGKDEVWSSTEDIENGLTLEDVVSFLRDVVMVAGNTDDDSKSVGGSDDARMVGGYDKITRDMITVRERDSNNAGDGCVVYGYEDGVVLKVVGERDVVKDYFDFGDEDGETTEKNGERIIVKEGDKDLELVDIKDGGREEVEEDIGAGIVKIGPN